VSLEQLTAIVGVLFMVLASVVAWVFKDALSTLRETIRELRTQLKELQTQVQESDHAVLGEKVRALENDYQLLHSHKNVFLPQMIDRVYQNATGHCDRETAKLEKRVEKLEHRER
jgi:hypothetical protein